MKFLINSLTILAIIYGLNVVTAEAQNPAAALPGATHPGPFAKKYSEEKILSALSANEGWNPIPAYHDRRAWNALPDEVRKSYVAAGERALNYGWPPVKATDYLAFIRTGDRIGMSGIHFERRDMLKALIMAELVEGKGRFIDQIVNGMWSHCEETFWGISAHVRLQKKPESLPDVTEPVIDLFAAENAEMIAWAYHFFKADFDKVHPLIAERINIEVRRRILEPYYTRKDFPWMGFDGKAVNNWNPWINFNVLSCILLMENNKAQKAKAVFKVMRSLDNYINSVKQDGWCDEGPGYWNVAGGKLAQSLFLLDLSTGGGVNISEDEKVRNIGKYIYKAYIKGSYYVNFADATPKVGINAGVVYRFGKYIHDPTLQGFGSFLAREWNKKWPADGDLFNLFNAKEVIDYPQKEVLLSDFWCPDNQIAGGRDTGGSSDGFFFCAKGGNNDESHNHNDVGNFILYYNGKPMLVDVGQMTYTRATFNSQRYTLWPMQSAYHNVPTINGEDQKDGPLFRAKNVNYSKSVKDVRFSQDLSDAYPKTAGIRSWIRTYVLNRNRNFTVEDHFVLDKVSGETVMNFISPCTLKLIEPGRISLSDDKSTVYLHYNARTITPLIEPIKIDDKKIQSSWPSGLSRLRLKLNSAKKTTDNLITISSN